MTVTGLRKVLEREEKCNGWYSLDKGVIRGEIGYTCFFESKKKKWEVAIVERNKIIESYFFDTEDSACRKMLDLMLVDFPHLKKYLK